MTTIQFRRTLVGIAMASAIFALAVPPAYAQPANPEPPAAGPKCGAAAGLMANAITTTPPSPAGTTAGRSLISVQRVSPINGSPDNLSNNGFTKICQRLDLPGGLAFDVNGDSIADTAKLLQHDGHDGLVNEHECNNTTPNAGASWDEGQGVEMRVFLGGGALSQDVALVFPGVECSQKFVAYKNNPNPPALPQGSSKGRGYFPLPLSSTCADRGCICDQLNLPNGTIVWTIENDPGVLAVNGDETGDIEAYNCVTPRDLDGNPPLRVGEAVYIYGGNAPTGVTTEGNAVNCLTPVGAGAPCAAPPSADYSSPLIF
jgi:hypothetical protein